MNLSDLPGNVASNYYQITMFVRNIIVKYGLTDLITGERLTYIDMIDKLCAGLKVPKNSALEKNMKETASMMHDAKADEFNELSTRIRIDENNPSADEAQGQDEDENEGQDEDK